MTERQSLEDLFGEENVPQSLRDCANGMMATPRAPVVMWRRVGYSGAVLARVDFDHQNTEGGSLKIERLIVKVLPKGPNTRETGAHDIPWKTRRTQKFADRHLVKQRYPRYPVGDGRYLMFQEVPHDLRHSKTVRELSPEHQAEACRRIAHLVAFGWNELDDKDRIANSPTPPTAREYLATELRGALDEGKPAYQWAARNGLVSSDRPFLVIEGEVNHRLPNPVLLALPGSKFEKMLAECVVGFSHGDLHWDNALVMQQPSQQPEFDHIRLIDLAAFESAAPVTRDIATLVLHITAEAVRGRLTSDEAEVLLRFTINPWERPAGFAKPALLDAINGVYSVVDRLPPEWQDDWRTQYLLSIHAHALTFTAFDDAGPHWNWWYTRLASHAAQIVLEQHQEPIALPRRPSGQAVTPEADDHPAEMEPDGREQTASDAAGPHLVDVADRVVAMAHQIGPVTSPKLLLELVEPLRLRVVELDGMLRAIAPPPPDDLAASSTRRIDLIKALYNARHRTNWLVGILPRTPHSARIAAENGFAAVEQAEAVHAAVTAVVSCL